MCCISIHAACSVSVICKVSTALWSQGHIIYAYTALEVDYHCSQILSQPPQAVGFDIEWRVTYKAGEALRKTALLQLCSKDPHGSYKCWLLHIARSGMTPSLLKLLQNEVNGGCQHATLCMTSLRCWSGVQVALCVHTCLTCPGQDSSGFEHVRLILRGIMRNQSRLELGSKVLSAVLWVM